MAVYAVLIKMQAPGKKVDKKGAKKGNQQKIAQQSVYDITVKECLVWPSKERDSRPQNADSEMVYMSMKAQKQARVDQAEQERQQQGGNWQIVNHDDGTVGEALRGWPKHRQPSAQHCQEEDDYPMEVNTPPPDTKKTVPKAKSKNSKSKKRVVITEPDDVHVCDLISQRYLHEYEEQRKAEQEAERLKKEASDREARQGKRTAKDRRDIKANRAAQLRSIALADKVDSSTSDLWKMDKFVKNARPHLSTFRKDRNGSGSGMGRQSRESIHDHDSGPCTCPEYSAYYEFDSNSPMPMSPMPEDSDR